MSDHDKKPEHDNEDVDEAIDESFPASDPPAHSGGSATPSDDEHGYDHLDHDGEKPPASDA